MNLNFSEETKKVENACNWCCECIVSGYTILLWEKLINFSSKMIHINSPNIPFYLLKKNRILFNQIERLGRSKENVLLLRNSQMVRNLLFDVVSIFNSNSLFSKNDKSKSAIVFEKKCDFELSFPFFKLRSVM